MAAPDGRVVSRPQRLGQGSGRGPKGRGACLHPLDSLEQKETQEQTPGQLDMLRKAQEFFQTCDGEGKGFIARKDMQVSGVPARSAHRECQMSPCLGLELAPWEVTSLTEKVPSILSWKERSDQTLLGAGPPGFILFLAFTCCQTPGLFPLCLGNFLGLWEMIVVT